jgi:hypothetical protein
MPFGGAISPAVLGAEEGNEVYIPFGGAVSVTVAECFGTGF